MVLLRRVLLNLTETKTGNESDLNSKISRDLPWSNGSGEPMMAAGYIQMQNHDVARDLVCIVMRCNSSNNKPSGKLTTFVRVTSRYNTSSKLRGSPKE